MIQDVEAAVERLRERAAADLDWVRGGHASPEHSHELRKHAGAITTLIADHERLKGAIDALPGPLTLASYRARAEAAEARCARLEGALKPFAEATEQFRPDDADTMRPAVVQAVHFRGARAALKDPQ